MGGSRAEWEIAERGCALDAELMSWGDPELTWPPINLQTVSTFAPVQPAAESGLSLLGWGTFSTVQQQL